MAQSKISIALFFLFALVMIGTLVPVATADACTDECYKNCEKDKDDVRSCTNTCDDLCRFRAVTKAYASAPPAEKAAGEEIFEKEVAAAFARSIATNCLHECNNKLCGTGKKDLTCSAKCNNVCRVLVEGLSFAGIAYDKAPPAGKKAIIQAIDKQASGPGNKVEAYAAICINDCSKVCGEGKKDPVCAAICDNGCHARSVSLAFSLATSAKKEAIKKEIEALNVDGTA